MLDHVSIGVRDLAAARRCYDAVLATLGYRCVFEYDGGAGYGAGRAEFFRTKPRTPVPPDDRSGLHISFRAPTRAAVDAFPCRGPAARRPQQRRASGSAARLWGQLLCRLHPRPRRLPHRGAQRGSVLAPLAQSAAICDSGDIRSGERPMRRLAWLLDTTAAVRLRRLEIGWGSQRLMRRRHRSVRGDVGQRAGRSGERSPDDQLHRPCQSRPDQHHRGAATWQLQDRSRIEDLTGRPPRPSQFLAPIQYVAAPDCKTLEIRRHDRTDHSRRLHRPRRDPRVRAAAQAGGGAPRGLDCRRPHRLQDLGPGATAERQRHLVRRLPRRAARMAPAASIGSGTATSPSISRAR